MAELFGSWTLVTRIDRDTRPLFFASTADEADTGTGGGIVVDYPLVRSEWTGNKLGDLWLGGKVNLLRRVQTSRSASAARGMVKLPVGDDESGASTGETDFVIDGIVSGYTTAVDVVRLRRHDLPRQSRRLRADQRPALGLRRGVPAKFSLGFRFTAELFGEKYFDNDHHGAGRPVRHGRLARCPLIDDRQEPRRSGLGLTWQAPNGFFIGGRGAAGT